MSVPSYKRAESELQVLVNMQELLYYTIGILKNEQIFPKKHRWICATHISKAVMDAYVQIRKANATRVECDQDYKYRRQNQIEAIGNLESLYGLIDIAYNQFNIDSSKIEYWVSLLYKTTEKTKSWAKADKKRYTNEEK